jgi:hypothetical protein
MNRRRGQQDRERRVHAEPPGARSGLHDLEAFDENRLAGTVPGVVARRARAAHAVRPTVRVERAVVREPAPDADLVADLDVVDAAADERVVGDQVII